MINTDFEMKSKWSDRDIVGESDKIKKPEFY